MTFRYSYQIEKASHFLCIFECLCEMTVAKLQNHKEKRNQVLNF